MCWSSCTHSAEGFGLKLLPSHSKRSLLNMGIHSPIHSITQLSGGKRGEGMEHIFYMFRTKLYVWDIKFLVDYLLAPFILAYSTNYFFYLTIIFWALTMYSVPSTRGWRINKIEPLPSRDLIPRHRTQGLNSSPWPHWPQMTQLFWNENGRDCVCLFCFWFCFEKCIQA